MEQLLQSGESLEFFLEGSRSRSGKPCTPKAGLLSVVVDTIREGEQSGSWVQPVHCGNFRGRGNCSNRHQQTFSLSQVPALLQLSEVLTTGLVEDVLVVPLNISYDRLVETTFVKNELMVSLVCVGWGGEV